MANNNKSTLIDFSNPDLFVPVYRPLLFDKNRKKIIYGGRGSAKSFYAAQHKIIRCLSQKKFKCLMVRKMRADVGKSVYATVEGVIKLMGLESLFRCLESRHTIICIANGNRFIPLGVNEVSTKSGTGKSIFNPTDAIIEEADELTEDEYDKLSMSLRGSKSLEEILLFNPPNPDHWIVKAYFPERSTFEKQDGSHTYIESTQPNVTILHTNYLMNPYCQESEKRNHEELGRKNPEKFKTQSLGMLAKPRKDGLALPNFNDSHIYQEELFSPRLRAIEAWDYNRLPHHTVGLWQMHLDGNTFYIDLCKEFCIPELSVRQVQQKVNQYLKDENYEPNKVRYIGDFSGKAKRDHDIDPMSVKVKDEIRKAGFQVIDETKPNPSVATSTDFFNDILGGLQYLSKQYGGGESAIQIQVRVHASCVYHIQDFEECKVTADGKILKTMTSEKYVDNDGNTVTRKYQKRGHGVDESRYLMVGALEDEYEEYKQNE